ncbi:hypothetical protein PSM36_2318 [Proteiniphilum saccharofermentans]|uniref:Uncharacterized protein n=1 Tax=Proteiniphilum saccharofermentans TaxID=1642647 RepID=A0A1R3SY57_9BACT|nr:hypothetical protein PSM36_2318 [Proteiniphilum saccharofermentans]
MLDWDIAELSNDSIWEVVELPWEYEEVEEIFALSEVWEYAGANNLMPGQVIKLVVIRHKQTGKIYGFKMKIAPDLDYMLDMGEDLKTNNYLVRDNDFSGIVIFCTLDDRFINGWQYRDGVICGKLVPANGEDAETPVTVSGTRMADWHIELDEVVIIGYVPKGLMHADMYTQENGYLVFPPDDMERAGQVDIQNPLDLSGGSGSENNKDKDSDSDNTASTPELKDLNEIILDDSFKDTKAECIYNKLLNLSGGFKKAIQKFDGEFPVSHLYFSVSYDLSPNVNGRTYPPQKFITRIEINGNNLDRPNLDIARTIVHETIHAEIHRKMLSAAQKGELDYNGWTQAEIIQYVKNIQNDFPGIFDFYTRYYKDNDWHHQQMAAYYREWMINILKEIDPTQTPETYEALAWVGLRGTTAWEEKSKEYQDNMKKIASDFAKKGGEPCW